MAYLSIANLAKALDVSRSVAYRMVAAGEIAAVDIGRNGRQKLRVSQEALDAYIASRPATAAVA